MRRSERFPSKYVQASDLPPGGVTVVIDKVRMEEVGQGSDKKMKPVLYFQNARKAMVLNSTNDEQIGKLLGSDDDREWHGERIVLYPTTTFGGKTVPCIRVRAVNGATTTGAEEESENPAPPVLRKSSPSRDDIDIGDDLEDSIPF
jgi:hypothetical protein